MGRGRSGGGFDLSREGGGEDGVLVVVVVVVCHWFKDPRIFLPRSCTLFFRVLGCVSWEDRLLLLICQEVLTFRLRPRRLYLSAGSCDCQR